MNKHDARRIARMLRDYGITAVLDAAAGACTELCGEAEHRGDTNAEEIYRDASAEIMDMVENSEIINRLNTFQRTV